MDLKQAVDKNREALIQATNDLEEIYRYAVTGSMSVVRRKTKEALDRAKKVCDDDDIGWTIANFITEGDDGSTS